MRNRRTYVFLAVLISSVGVGPAAAHPTGEGFFRYIGIGFGSGYHAYNCCRDGRCADGAHAAPGVMYAPAGVPYSPSGVAPTPAEPVPAVPVEGGQAARHPLNLSGHNWTPDDRAHPPQVHRLPPVEPITR